MIDLAALVSLFAEALGATKGWPRIARFERLHDAERETVVHDLRVAQVMSCNGLRQVLQ